ncbi:MAG: crossover junction endodeoxyribonuclease RuvC [Alphaproteobacteria bacterium]
MASYRILGCDPGLGCTGWGIIDSAGLKLAHVANGAIETAARDSLGLRLAALHSALSRVIRLHRPVAVAVEQAFVHKDPAAALKLGHARAVALLAAAQAGLEVAEYTPNHVKKSVVGVGHASKEQIQAMVRYLLPSVRIAAADSADALAVAIAHAHLSRTNARISAAMVAT